MSTDRHQAGSPRSQGGRFRPTARAEASDVSLNAGRPDVLNATTEQLWEHVYDPDWAVRLTAARAPALSTEQMHALADPDRQPAVVRLAVAGLLNPGVAVRAAEDPHPLVRAQASVTGWDLDTRLREQLRLDPEIALAKSLLATA